MVTQFTFTYDNIRSSSMTLRSTPSTTVRVRLFMRHPNEVKDLLRGPKRESDDD